jgi:hypothetical protein
MDILRMLSMPSDLEELEAEALEKEICILERQLKDQNKLEKALEAKKV